MHLKPCENIKHSLSLPYGSGHKSCLVGCLKLKLNSSRIDPSRKHPTLFSEIQKPINCIWNKEEFAEQWKESIFIRRVIKLTVVIIDKYQCC
jgi:hypothetical protein